MISRSAISSRFIRAIEKISIKLPDYIIIDTPVYSEWYQKEYKLGPNKIRLLPLGADDREFQPQSQPKDRGHFQCLYYGTYIPNHGVQYIVEAARLLADQPSIQFKLIGTGPDKKQIEALVRQYGLNSVQFYDWMSKNDLIQAIGRADLVLGTFGTTPQALMTMQNKIFEGLAMAKPVINGDLPQMRKTLIHGENIYLCERESPRAIADAILTLYHNDQLRQQIAQNGYAFYQENFSFDKLGAKFANILREVANGHSG